MFEWDSRKAKSNRLKHGVSFEEAATAFLDPTGLDGETCNIHIEKHGGCAWQKVVWADS
jgi:uncharacterized DUF497 family protein